MAKTSPICTRGSLLRCARCCRSQQPLRSPLPWPRSCAISGHRDDIPARALHAVGLEGYADKLYQELSGGEQQRTQLARVLCQVWHPVQNGLPRWLLLDEPVASLDIGHQLMVMRLLKDFANRGGGVVAVMHDLNLSAMFADHMAMIKDGQILKHGAPADVMQNAILSQAYGCTLTVNTPAAAGQSYILPHVAQERMG
jgi:iron complex transport system ATP-binding protein